MNSIPQNKQLINELSNLIEAHRPVLGQRRVYERVVPLRRLPAFTSKSKPVATEPRKEWECAVAFLQWLKERLKQAGRHEQRLLMVADGEYDTLNLWKQLPAGVILMVRSTKNRVLWTLPVGGVAQVAGRSIPFGAVIAPPCGRAPPSLSPLFPLIV